MVRKGYKISDPLILKKTCCFMAESGRLGVKHQFTYLLTPGRTGQGKELYTNPKPIPEWLPGTNITSTEKLKRAPPRALSTKLTGFCGQTKTKHCPQKLTCFWDQTRTIKRFQLSTKLTRFWCQTRTKHCH